MLYMRRGSLERRAKYSIAAIRPRPPAYDEAAEAAYVNVWIQAYKAGRQYQRIKQLEARRAAKSI